MLLRPKHPQPEQPIPAKAAPRVLREQLKRRFKGAIAKANNTVTGKSASSQQPETVTGKSASSKQPET
eukprot:399356-Alexandrium_andersonii.AAC.1